MIIFYFCALLSVKFSDFDGMAYEAGYRKHGDCLSDNR